ncbi:MAG: SDR family oxidoreductase [Sulfuritalea sp.]|jgi:NAD(P)-dependent dehydrogenase (short-subunit alcohol dehydrogenase family)|nr:SDR family oxidoreductase [Sulfuritalea sp.]
MSHPLAVVTGAASGIGLALTQALLARSVDVIAIDKDAFPVAGPPGLTAIQSDIADAEAMQRIAGNFAQRPLHYLFANAGIGGPASAFGASAEEWQRVWNVNAMGPLNTLRSWWPSLTLAGGKAVVTVSAAALLTYPGAASYRATKAALLSMLENLFYDTRGSGVSLHALCPGMVKSNILTNALPPGAAKPCDPFSLYLEQAMRIAEPAEAFAQRVLETLDSGQAPFYWLTHPEVRAGIETRYRSIAEGHPSLQFGEIS